MTKSKSLDGVNDELKQRTQLVLAALPSAWVASALRSTAEQKRLYDGWIKKLPGFAPANKPGTSMHEKGLAVDIDCAPGDNKKRTALFKKYGLYAPHPAEEWHGELDPKRKPLDSKEKSMAKPVDACSAPHGGHWVLTEDGGVRANNGAPFYGSYPGLKENERQGKRSFIAIEQSAHGGYIIYGDDDTSYEFNPK